MKIANRILQLYRENKLLYNLIFISTLFFAHCFWGNMMYIVFPILAIMVIFDSLKNGLSYIIFSIPFCFLNVYISSILILACTIIYIIKFYTIRFFKEKVKPNLYVLISVAIFFIYTILPIGDYNLNMLIRVLLFAAIFIIFSMITKKPDTFRLEFNIKILAYAIIIASIFSLSYYFSPYLQDYMIMIYVKENLPRFMALFYHPNVLAMFCEITTSTLAYFIISKKAKKESYILFVIIALIGLLTFSKTYLIILALMLLTIFIWSMCCNYKKTLIITLIIVLIISIFCLIFSSFVTTFVERFIGNLNNCSSFRDFMNMVTTDRYDLWIEYLTYIFHNPIVLFFGRGVGASHLSTISPHNAYISCVYQLGLVGTALFGTVLFFIFKDNFKKKINKTNWAILIPIITICLMLFVEDFIFYLF